MEWEGELAREEIQGEKSNMNNNLENYFPFYSLPLTPSTSLSSGCREFLFTKRPGNIVLYDSQPLKNFPPFPVYNFLFPFPLPMPHTIFPSFLKIIAFLFHIIQFSFSLSSENSLSLYPIQFFPLFFWKFLPSTPHRFYLQLIDLKLKHKKIYSKNKMSVKR